MKNPLKCAAVAAVCLSMFAIHGAAADRVRTVNEGGIRDQWMLADGVKLTAPGYPADFAARGDNVCVAMGYAIKPDGTTSDFTLLKAWSSSTGEKEPVDGFWEAFAQVSAGALSQWKFKPRPEVAAPQSTYTVATMNFMGKQAEDPAQLRSHCGIADLAATMQKAQSSRYQNSGGKMEQDILRQQQAAQNAQRMSQRFTNPQR